MTPPATVISRLTLDADRTLYGGLTVWVSGILATNTTGGALTTAVTTANGATARFSITVPAGQTLPIDIPFLADGGLKFASAAAAGFIITVFHSQGGM